MARYTLSSRILHWPRRAISINYRHLSIRTIRTIRLRGRLMRSKYLPYITREPIILPRDNMITRRIVEYHHACRGHANYQTVLNDIRKRYVIPRIKNLLNKVVRNCQYCAVYHARPEFPEMAQLPLERMDYGCRPFKHVGIDCFVPVYVVQDG